MKDIQQQLLMAAEGGLSIIAFMAALPGIKVFRPNREADPLIYSALRKAKDAGVYIYALGLHFDPRHCFIHLRNPSLKVKF